MSTLETIRKHRDQILDVATEHGATRVRIFGSVARGEEAAGSDIDFLVAFEPNRSLLDHVSLTRELRDLLGRDIDIVSERGLSRHMATRILSEAVPL